MKTSFLCAFVLFVMIQRLSKPMKTEPFDCQYAAWIVNALFEGFQVSTSASWVFARRLSLLLIALKDEPSLCNHSTFLPEILGAASEYFILFWARERRGWWGLPCGHIQDVSVCVLFTRAEPLSPLKIYIPSSRQFTNTFMWTVHRITWRPLSSCFQESEETLVTLNMWHT